MKLLRRLLFVVIAALPLRAADVVDASSIRGKVLCGYQGWFRCPGDALNAGWVHWSREGKRIVPETLTFEMWPDMTEFPDNERYAAPGFTDAQGRQAHLFSSDNAGTVRRHFDWMQTCGIDGVWLQRFLVDIRDGPGKPRYDSRMRVLEHVHTAARATGRAWALTYDLSGMPPDRIFETLTADWKRLVDAQIANDARYLREGGKPVVEVWGFYRESHGHKFPPALANQIIDFFKAPGPYAAYLVGGGDWDWRRNPDPEWQAIYRRFDAYSPWNTANVSIDETGVSRATTNYWMEDKLECEKNGMLWLPVVYPGFSWDNLAKKPPGSTNTPRRGGAFLWEQFHALSNLGADSVCVAMFDEVDEGTAIFKVTNDPPIQAHFLTYEGLPSDWYLRLVGEATRLMREFLPVPPEIPIQP
jgi:hypothetical protein